MVKRKKPRRERRHFTPEFKAEAVRLCKVGDRTVTQVALDLDLTETALREWVKRAEVDAGNGPPGALASDERAELTHLRRENKRLQMEREILKKSGSLLRQGEHVRFAFILVEKAFYSIVMLCRVLGVSRSGFHAWARRPRAQRARSDAQLAAHVAAVHKRSRGTYGSPRVHAELRAKGVRVGKKRVERLMRENGLEARGKRRFRKTTDSKHPNPIAPSIVAREFDVAEPNRVWATDVTAIWTAEGWPQPCRVRTAFQFHSTSGIVTLSTETGEVQSGHWCQCRQCESRRGPSPHKYSREGWRGTGPCTTGRHVALATTEQGSRL
jgi:transposase-like protein